jgi:2,4-dienoyl-CoA reductase-like NADH-dependent reductase (Old Yellow Enzyme family)
MATIQDHLVINGMRLRNRIALPPLTTNCAGEDGRVTESILRFYRDRSKDAGLVIVEATAVRPDGRIVPGSLGLWEDGQVAGMARLADTIRNLGAAAVVQLNHAGARCTPAGGEMQGASPSGFEFRSDVKAFAMSRAQIDEMARCFGDAARRAVSAGFEGVEIHGAHFYLISQFLSPFTNKRNDLYGGDARGRTTFALQVVKGVRDKVGQRYPILFRLNAVESIEDGQSLEDAIVVSRLLGENGVDALHVSVVTGGSWKEEKGRRFFATASALSKDAPAGSNVPLAARLKKETGMPVIAVGKLAEGNAASDAVAKSGVDVVAIGRQMLADPDAAGKVLEGKGSEIIPCKECLNCFASIWKGKPVSCTVNKGLGGWEEK